MKLPDYSEYLNKEGMLEYIESEWQNTIDNHKKQAAIINSIGAKSIIEIGCSTGNLAQFLKCDNYIGYDNHLGSIEIAFKKDPSKKFVVKDIRDLKPSKSNQSHLVCAMAVMKHFGLHEWDAILKKIISLSSEPCVG